MTDALHDIAFNTPEDRLFRVMVDRILTIPRPSREFTTPYDPVIQPAPARDYSTPFSWRYVWLDPRAPR